MKPSTELNQDTLDALWPRVLRFGFIRWIALAALTFFGVTRMQAILDHNFPSAAPYSFALSVVLLVVIQLLTGSVARGPAWLLAWRTSRGLRPVIGADEASRARHRSDVQGAWIELVLFAGLFAFDCYLDMAYVPVLADKIIAEAKVEDPNQAIGAYQNVAKFTERSEGLKNTSLASKKNEVINTSGVTTAEEKRLRNRLRDIQKGAKPGKGEVFMIEKRLAAIGREKQEKRNAAIGALEGQHGRSLDSLSDAYAALAKSALVELDTISARNKRAVDARTEKVDAGAWAMRGFIIALLGLVFYAAYLRQYVNLVCGLEEKESAWSQLGEALADFFEELNWRVAAGIAYLLPETQDRTIKRRKTVSSATTKLHQKIAENAHYRDIFRYICEHGPVPEYGIYTRFRDEQKPLKVREALIDLLNAGAVEKANNAWKAGKEAAQFRDFFSIGAESAPQAKADPAPASKKYKYRARAERERLALLELELSLATV